MLKANSTLNDADRGRHPGARRRLLCAEDVQRAARGGRKTAMTTGSTPRADAAPQGRDPKPAGPRPRRDASSRPAARSASARRFRRPHLRGAGGRSTTRSVPAISWCAWTMATGCARACRRRRARHPQSRPRRNESTGRPAQDRRTAEDNARQRRTAAGHRPRGIRPGGQGPRARTAPRRRRRQGSRGRQSRRRSVWMQARVACARRSRSMVCRPRPGRKRPCRPAAPSCRWRKPRLSARAFARRSPARRCRSAPRLARWPRPRRRTCW